VLRTLFYRNGTGTAQALAALDACLGALFFLDPGVEQRAI
jgi:hypothetical protein